MLLLLLAWQCGSLLDEKQRDDFVEEISDEYAEVRDDHYDSLRDRRYLPLDDARKRRFNVDWMQQPPARQCMTSHNFSEKLHLLISNTNFYCKVYLLQQMTPAVVTFSCTDIPGHSSHRQL